MRISARRAPVEADQLEKLQRALPCGRRRVPCTIGRYLDRSRTLIVAQCNQ